MAPNAPPIACTLSVRGMARRALCRARCGAGNSTSSSAPNGSANSAFRKMRQGCQDAPGTGEAIKIKASKKIAFRPAKELKEAV
jgi:hypothetical protein